MSQRNTFLSPIPIIFLLLLCLNSSNGSPINRIVVLVMENRSFDHMLGWMKKLNPEIDGVNGTEFNSVSASDPKSKKFFFNNTAHYVDPDPGHSFEAIREQVFGSNDTSAKPAPMNGFAQNAYSMDPSMNMSENVMNGFEPDQVPVYKALVSEFAVFDRWFASLPTSTQPNRLYVHSATSHGLLSNEKGILAKGMPQTTIFDSLNDGDRSWAVYFQQTPTTLFYKNLRKLKYVGKFRPYSLWFKSDAEKGKLPSYTVIEPTYFDIKIQKANDDHPSHDVYEGQKFVKEVYEALRASPQWNETMLIITYDEHGGFYDHVPTPVSGVPAPDDVPAPDRFNFHFDRLGVRVPTIVVSPWVEKGTVVHGPNGPTPTSEFEHSSIPATVRKLFNLTSPFLTKRDAWAGTFEDIFQKRTEPRTDCPEQLPEPVKIREKEPNEEAKITEFQEEIVELAAALVGETSPTKHKDTITVKQAKQFIDGSLQRFFEAGRRAIEMGVDGEQIVQMRPSLTTRSSNNFNVHV